MPTWHISSQQQWADGFACTPVPPISREWGDNVPQNTQWRRPCVAPWIRHWTLKYDSGISPSLSGFEFTDESRERESSAEFSRLVTLLELFRPSCINIS